MFALISLCGLVLSGCGKKPFQEPEPLSGAEYFPLQKGAFVVYDCDSTVYTDLNRDTIKYRFQLKQRIGEPFTDNEGNQAFSIERFVKIYSDKIPYESQAWRVKDVWMLNVGENDIQVVEANQRKIKMIFPVREGAAWNGNAYNAEGEEIYTYNYTDRTENIAGKEFTVTRVNQFHLSTLISLESRSEKYASGVGLIEKQNTTVYSQDIQSNKPVTDRIEKGFIYTQTLNTYGIE